MTFMLGAPSLAVVIARPEERAGNHCRNRPLEWLTSAMLIGSGLILILYPKSIAGTAFRLMLDAGFQQAWLGPFFLGFGMLGIVALYQNGAWPAWGPAIRGLRCCAAAALWFQILYALYVYGTKTGAMPVGVAVYSVLLAAEFFSVNLAAHDVKRAT